MLQCRRPDHDRVPADKAPSDSAQLLRELRQSSAAAVFNVNVESLSLDVADDECFRLLYPKLTQLKLSWVHVTVSSLDKVLRACPVLQDLDIGKCITSWQTHGPWPVLKKLSAALPEAMFRKPEGKAASTDPTLCQLLVCFPNLQELRIDGLTRS